MISFTSGVPADPIAFARLLWPHIRFYKQQEEIIYSVVYNDETFVPAGNKLGKDFVAGFIVLWFFLTRHPCRVVTTSAKDDHLRVLWGEIGRYIQECKYPLDWKKGGPLIINHQDIKKIVDKERCPLSYLTGLVASADSIAAMQGHHIAKTGDGVPRTLFVCDESSSVHDDYYKLASTWFNRALIFGNTWPCNNFFYRGVTEGNIKAKDNGHFYRKVIKIKAADSPNIRYALAQIAAGLPVTNEMIVPGVKDYEEYLKDRQLWDAVQQCVSLDAEFWQGADLLLYPPEWLNRAERIWDELRRGGNRIRKAKAIGIDPGEGGDKTAMAAVDDLGLIELVSRKTPNTAVITGEAIAFGRKHNVPPEKWFFDRGGGGKEHADRLRAQGYKVQTVAFGESPSLEIQRVRHQVPIRKDMKEDKYAYVNRRAEMYGMLRELIDPSLGPGFGLPPASEGLQYAELRHQLSKFPLQYDDEGRMKLPPKNKPATASSTSKIVTLVDLIGHSPDEADALVLAVYGMGKRSTVVTAQVF